MASLTGLQVKVGSVVEIVPPGDVKVGVESEQVPPETVKLIGALQLLLVPSPHEYQALTQKPAAPLANAVPGLIEQVPPDAHPS